MSRPDPLLAATRLLDFNDSAIGDLIAARGWADLDKEARARAAYEFVRDEIAFGYNRADAIQASDVLTDGHGQCNTKGTLLMALFRALGLRCRLHGFTIHKALQRGVVPEAVYPFAPEEILHSWVEVEIDARWIVLEGFILDTPFLERLQAALEGQAGLCGYGAGTDSLSAPPVVWTGHDTYIQKTGIARDLGTFDSPDAFYAAHSQRFGALREWLYRHGIRHWMNARVRALRAGREPDRRLNHSHAETADVG